jgi:hypothetical protein
VRSRFYAHLADSFARSAYGSTSLYAHLADSFARSAYGSTSLYAHLADSFARSACGSTSLYAHLARLVSLSRAKGFGRLPSGFGSPLRLGPANIAVWFPSLRPETLFIECDSRAL